MAEVTPVLKERSRMRRASTLIVLLLFLGCSAGDKPHDKLNGTWISDLLTVTIDFQKGTYQGVGMGQQFSQDLSIVSENANVVVFKTGRATIVCQFQGDGGIMLTKQGPEGGLPIILHRAKQ